MSLCKEYGYILLAVLKQANELEHRLVRDDEGESVYQLILVHMLAALISLALCDLESVAGNEHELILVYSYVAAVENVSVVVCRHSVGYLVYKLFENSLRNKEVYLTCEGGYLGKIASGHRVHLEAALSALESSLLIVTDSESYRIVRERAHRGIESLRVDNARALLEHLGVSLYFKALLEVVCGHGAFSVLCFKENTAYRRNIELVYRRAHKRSYLSCHRVFVEYEFHSCNHTFLF